MKKIAIAGMSALMLGQVQAQSLEERVEALEYKSYENFLKVSGSLEMRFDYINQENKEPHRVITDATTYGTALQTVAATAASTAEAGAFFAANCGDTVTTTGTGTPPGGLKTTKDGCQDVEKGSENSRLGRMFLNVDIESNPTNRLSFYGRLSMAKYISQISSSGDRPNTQPFGDLRAGAAENDASVWVERAFANYAVTDDLTFTFGRLPTIDGAPYHHHKNQPMAGSYPILAFSGIFDGMALTQNFGAHTVRAIYAPFSTPNYDDVVTRQEDANGDRVPRMADTYAFMYEYKAPVNWARNVHVIAMHNMFDLMPVAGSTLKLGIQRTSLYAEALDVAGSGFDIAVHGMSSTTDSEGSLIGLDGTGGWLTGENEDTNTGSAYGALVKYNFKNGFMKNSALGVEHFKGEKGAFLYDTASFDPVSMYTTYGSANRVFFTKDFEGGLKWHIQYLNQHSDSTYEYLNIIGSEVDIDRTTDVLSTSFTAYF